MSYDHSNLVYPQTARRLLFAYQCRLQDYDTTSHITFDLLSEALSPRPISAYPIDQKALQIASTEDRSEDISEDIHGHRLLITGATE